MNCQPRATGLPIASAQCVRAIGPPIGVLCRPRVKFITIAGNDQRVLGADPMCDDEQADSSASRFLDPVIDESPRDRYVKGQLGEIGAQFLTRKPTRVFKFAVVEGYFL